MGFESVVWQASTDGLVMVDAIGNITSSYLVLAITGKSISSPILTSMDIGCFVKAVAVAVECSSRINCVYRSTTLRSLRHGIDKGLTSF